ncbi:uncharacterized protein LOC111697052 isoform X2 [Eurytemora carolleeae]|nr:uncharacterized protein LOC111697052 isoform X2 [Eurytemora carolleeae]|eukprot:XP_023322692.1 uncharacterized protein LOC111697052 isoform X2 [Eurytemora affinis]
MSENKTPDTEKLGEESLGMMKRIRRAYSLMTIEPLMLLLGVASNMINVPQEQMLLYKICSESQFNVTDEYCRHFEEHKNESTYNEIESEVVYFNNIITYAEYFLPVIISFYIGSWSDIFGRKGFIALCVAAKTLAAFFNLLNAIFLSSWNRWIWLGTVVAVKNLSGGYLVFIMVTYSFISDNCTPEDRTLRMGILNFSWAVSKPIASGVGGLLYSNGGFVCVFAASLLLFILGALFGIIKLYNFKEKISRTGRISCSKIFTPRHIGDAVKTTFKKRPNNKRMYILMLIMMMLVLVISFLGEHSFQLMYTKRYFEWNGSDYIWFDTTRSLISSFGLILLLPLFKHFNLHDTVIIIIATLSSISGALVKAFSQGKGWMFYISAALEIVSSLHGPPIRAEMLRCCAPEETGKMFAMLSSVESLVPILATTIYTRLYDNMVTHKWFSGLCYLVSTGFHVVGLILALIMIGGLRCKEIPLEDSQRSLKRLNSNLHPDNMKFRDHKQEIFLQSFRPLDF